MKTLPFSKTHQLKHQAFEDQGQYRSVKVCKRSGMAFIIILNRPASKKNSRRNFGHVSLPSKAYLAFHDDALRQLKKVKERFIGPVIIHYAFYQKGKMRQDVDNAIASINDVLQDARIIDDDANIIAGSFSKRSASEWRTEITIESFMGDLSDPNGEMIDNNHEVL